MLSLTLMVIVGFFMGSIPTGYILVKRMKGIDIRTVGSGNLGATNVGRVLGRKWFFITMGLDALKGYIPVFISVNFFSSYNIAVMCGIAVLLGHMFSPFVNFKGGKGVASSLGIGLALAPMLMISAVAVFSIVLYFYRMISLSSIAAAIFIVFVSYFLALPFLVKSFFILAGILVVVLHYKNIKRILDGTESKIGEKIDINSGDNANSDIHSHKHHHHTHNHEHHHEHSHGHHCGHHDIHHHGHTNSIDDYKRLFALIVEFFKRQLIFQEEDKAHKSEHSSEHVQDKNHHEHHHESQYERNNRHDKELWHLIISTVKGLFKGGSSNEEHHHNDDECCGRHRGGHSSDDECCGRHHHGHSHGHNSCSEDDCCDDDCFCGEGLYWDSKYNNPFRGNQRVRTNRKQLGYSTPYRHHRHYGHYGIHNIVEAKVTTNEKPTTVTTAKTSDNEKTESKKSTKSKKSEK